MNHRILLISIIIVLTANFFGLFEIINNAIYDNYIIFNKEKTSNSKIIIVEIDNKSIKPLGYWPWKRNIYSKAIQNIINASPDVIGINLSFTETQGNPEEDNELYKTLQTFKNIVLTTKFKYLSSKSIRVLLPERSIFPGIKQGHTFFQEKDIIRTVPPHKIIPAFSLAVLDYYYKKNSDLQKTLSPELLRLLNPPNKINYSIDNNILIDYKRTPDKFKHLSFIDVYNNRFNKEELKNKIVLIGVTDKYIAHFFSTPYTSKKESFSSSSVELQAQIIDSLLTFRNLKKCPLWASSLFALIITLIFFFLVKNKNFWLQGILFICTISIICLLDYSLFTYIHYWVPPAAALILISIIFSFHIYFTVTKVDNQIITAINDLKLDENITLSDTPTDINDKVKLLNSLVSIINTDRKTIKTIINGVNSGILVINKTGNVIWSNELSLRLFKENLVLNNNISELMVDTNIDQIIAIIKEKNIYKKELSINDQDFLCFISKIFTDKEQYIAIFNDITDLKEADRLKTDMIRMLSHELKTPLMNIVLASEFIEDFDNREETLKNNVLITDAATMMTSLINDFLNLNKLESNLIKANLTESDLHKVINKSIALQTPTAASKNVELILDTDEVPPVLVDQKLIDIVFNNLISNAIKYSFNDNKVIIKARTQTDTVNISIIDFGIGIAENEVNKVFKKFYRATNNEEKNIKGTGLGLSIVSKIISQHNSNISLKSKLNEGSTFSFDLPISK